MKVKLMAASAALAVAAGGGAVAAATMASAATNAPGWLSITLKSSSDATTGWSNGDPLLSPGTNSSATYAEMVVDGWNQYEVNGSSAPTTEPMFKTNNYNAGSPRFVIDLGNGNSLIGYPGLNLSGQSSPDANGMAWEVKTGNAYGNTYTDYQTAYTKAGADGQNVVVLDAYIVADGAQAKYTDTLSGVEYNGYWVAPPKPVGAPGAMMVGYGSKCVDDYRSGISNGTKIDLYSCNGTDAQKWTFEPDGTMRNNAGGPSMCLDDTGYGWQGTEQELYQCVGQSNQAWTYDSSTGHLVNDYNGLCLDDPGWVTTNGTALDVYKCVNQANEHWTQP